MKIMSINLIFLLKNYIQKFVKYLHQTLYSLPIYLHISAKANKYFVILYAKYRYIFQ